MYFSYLIESENCFFAKTYLPYSGKQCTPHTVIERKIHSKEEIKAESDLRVLRLLDKVAEDGEHDPRDLLLDGVAEDVGQDRDGVELVHLLGEQRVERQHPQAEYQLVLDLGTGYGSDFLVI